MRRLQELFLGVWWALCSSSVPGTALPLRPVPVAGQEAVPGLKQELLGSMQTLRFAEMP